MVIPTDGFLCYALGGIEQIGCGMSDTRVERRTLRKDQFAPRDNVIERKTLWEKHSSAETPFSKRERQPFCPLRGHFPYQGNLPLSLRDVSPTGSTAPLQ